jgi:glycosyltransferase involved in cell wall biosynthesis
MPFFFDLTTSAQWGGHPVGIVRVERELARVALKTRPDIRFCVYLRDANEFLEISRERAEQIVNGDGLLICARKPGPGESRPPSAIVRAKREARRILLHLPALYAWRMRRLGVELSAQQIAELRQWHPELPPSMRPVASQQDYAEDIAVGLAPLGADVTLISGGLDWEQKNARALYRLKKETGFRYCAVVYDLIPILWPHYVVPAYVNILREYFGELMWLADFTMCISRCTERDLLEFYEEFGVPQPKSAVFPLGCDIVQPGDDAELPAVLQGKRYALLVSTIEPRKNHRVVYEAFDRGLREGALSPERDRLVFVGRRGWAVEEMMQEIAANPVTRDTVVVLENVPDAQLARLYRDAAFTVFPSHYEGYGLPVAEALAYGKACVISGRGSLIEVDNDSAWRVDPKDTLGWAEAMSALFNDPARVEALERRVAERFRRTGWAEAGQDFFGKLTAMAA